MSICARIIISVALKQVDYAPDTKSGTERDNEGLQNGNCLIKKFHITSLSAAFCGGKNCLCWISGKKIAVVFSATAWERDMLFTGRGASPIGTGIFASDKNLLSAPPYRSAASMA